MSAAQNTSSNPSVSVLPEPRRVVTGHDESGRSVVLIDSVLEPQVSMPGVFMSTQVWTTEETPSKDNNTDIDGAIRSIPGAGLVVPKGTSHRYSDLAPGTTLPMHRTNSVDTLILISGRVVLILDGGERTEIKPGDVVVQRGTLHTWYNPSPTEWARVYSVLVHAEPAKVNGEELEEVWQT